jgi:hypothetical protein
MSKTKSIVRTATKPATANNLMKIENISGNLSRLADDLRKRSNQLGLVYELTELDDQNPVIIGATYFITEISKEIEKDAEWIEKCAKALEAQREKGGTQ